MWVRHITARVSTLTHRWMDGWMGPARLPGCLQTDRRTDRQTDRDAWPVGVVFVCVWIRSLASRVFVCVCVCVLNAFV